jgi:SAM-dependent methyltransferase
MYPQSLRLVVEEEMETQWTFDSDFTRGYTKVRQVFGAELLEGVRKEIDIASALDVGCGVGYFSKFLSDMRLDVTAIDGREENIAEAKRRYPEIGFFTRNVEDSTLPEIGAFDFVLCVGLLYHLENPLRAIRNLRGLTGKVLLVESMCIPGRDASMALLDEDRAHDQGLDYVAFYPTVACLIKMLYRAGFPFVYEFKSLPADPQFSTTVWRKRSRTFLAASLLPLTMPNLALAVERSQPVQAHSDRWRTNPSKVRDFWRNRLLRIRAWAARCARSVRGSTST